MQLTYAELSSPGPLRDTNEEALAFWQPQGSEERRASGAVAALADGIGGPRVGDVASRLAVDTSLTTFREATGSRDPRQLLIDIFKIANHAIYERAGEAGDGNRMATTLAVVLLLADEIVVGNVGDSRVYLVSGGKIRQLSTDDTYLGMQQKFGLISDEEAKTSEHRSVLTSCLGQQPAVRVDAERCSVVKGDRIVLCSDGLYRQVTDSEIAEAVSTLSPAQACRRLVSLAENRGTDDSLSIQVIGIGEIERETPRDGGPANEAEPRNFGYDLQPGQTLDDRFQITEIISRSGMATIFKATDLTTSQEVAIKVPFLQYESDPGFYSRFVREGEIGGKLDHPYLLKFVTVEHRSRPYLVTEYLRGNTLSHLLKNIGTMPEKDALQIAGRVCDALTHMHERGVIHRDLKPQNIMICYDGTIRILDFGIAKATGRRFTFSGFTPAMGTPEYMAPEQVKGRRGDERTDIYSLGAILYQMVVGKIPFSEVDEDIFVAMNARVTGDPVAPRKQNRDLSEQAEEIILHAMEREPKNRYASAKAMKEELDHPERVELTGRWQRLQTPSKWKRYWKSTALLVTVLAAILFGFVELILLIMRRGPQ